MEVIATAKLNYYDGESFGGYENLYLVVKFKEKGRFFKKKLERIVASERWVYSSEEEFKDIQSMDDYFAYAELYVSNKEWIEESVREMVSDYFKNKNQKDNIDSKRSSIIEKVDKSKKIEVKVSIK